MAPGGPRPLLLAGVADQKRNIDHLRFSLTAVHEFDGAIRARGITTLAGIADELTRQKWPTARGAESWSMMAVSNILKRTRSK